jgi:hypothetical protein
MPLYAFFHNLPNVLVQVANKMAFQKKYIPVSSALGYGKSIEYIVAGIASTIILDFGCKGNHGSIIVAHRSVSRVNTRSCWPSP